MVAPAYGRGHYSRSQINAILDTAYSTFFAAKIEGYIKAGYLKDNGEEKGVAPPTIVIHTGNWGTGAFGGNKIMMALLQLIAARMAGIDRMQFHTFSADGTEKYNVAVRMMNDLLPGPQASAKVVRNET
eukprot:TRINITY_DN335_c0_g1_i5.p1 TRINITY_DN335_c0_g1~~TRINITY_DN335_c0_g1_i5.p1  ORF type:complete len:129 (+),score=17.46 TRINITY_DN335_c0_g1_i5:773-1159(+)